MGRRDAWLTWSVFAAGLAVAGVIVVMGRPAGPGGPLSPAAMQAEYIDTLRKLKFPPGYQPRLQDPAAGQDGAFVSGAGAVDAGNAWFCAWAVEWNTYRRSDPARALGALETLAGPYPNGPFWLSLDKADGAGLKREVDQAQLGDTHAMEREIDAFGCR